MLGARRFRRTSRGERLMWSVAWLLAARRRVSRGWRAAGLADPLGQGVADLGGGVLLEEVNAGDGDLALVRPGAAEFSRRTDQTGPRVGVYEQLGNGVCGHPAAVAGDDLGDGCGFAVDGDLARPGEGGAAALAGLGKGALVLGQDLGCQRVLHACGKQVLHEEVVAQDHLLTGGGSERAEQAGGAVGKVVPADRADD